MLEMRIHGYGGEGIVTMAQLIAAAALKTGKNVQTMPHFGVERRGAPVKAALRISDDEIYTRSESYKPDILVLLNAKLLEAALSLGLNDKALLIINSDQAIATAYPAKLLDATGIAVNEGLVVDGVPFINIPLYGGICAVLDIPPGIVTEVIEEKWPGKIGKKNAEVAAIAYKKMKEGE